MKLRKHTLLMLVVMAMALSACGMEGEGSAPSLTTAQQDMATRPIITSTAIPLATLTATATEAATGTATATITLTPTYTLTLTPSITPTYAILRGKVIPENLNCRYGPGVMYLYKFGLVGGSNLEIFGRAEQAQGTWVLIRAIGGSNACWVNASQMDIQGEVMAVEPVDVHVVMAWSPYYGALGGSTAQREGDEVTVYWAPITLRAGDDSEQTPYVLETWVCRDGQLVFTPVGAWTPSARVIDEPGCLEPSHGAGDGG